MKMRLETYVRTWYNETILQEPLCEPEKPLVFRGSACNLQ